MAVDKNLFPIVDLLFRSADIYDQSLKLSKIARTVDFAWVHIDQQNFAASPIKFVFLCRYLNQL